MKKLVLFVVVVFMASCGGKTTLVYDLTLEQMVEQAQRDGHERIFVVMSNPDCPPCSDYVSNMNLKKNRRIFNKAMVNVIDASLPENKWISHWLCSSAFPTTCVFTSEGKLEAVISGGTGAAIECIGETVKGNPKCADYLYKKHYPVNGNYIAILNELLECKRGIEKGEDMGATLDKIMQKTDYPYPAYLKALNEDKQGRRDEAVLHAERVLGYDNLYFYYVYDDLYREAKYIINPDYTPQSDGMLVMAEEIILDDCKVGEPRRVAIHVENAGSFPTFIRDINTSCTCVELISPKQHRLEPGQTVDIDVEFTGENKGEVYREVTFFSNSSEPLKRVALRAKVI